jgi:hypothetical protein
MTLRHPGARLGLALLLLAVTGGESVGAIKHWQRMNLQPLIVGWQQFFRVQWDATRVKDQPTVDGYITNVWGFSAQNVQLLVSGYDRGGTMVGQLVTWGPSPITPGSRVYFDVPVPPAASYEVAIFAWDWVQVDGRRKGIFRH